MESYKTVPNNVVEDFNESIKLTENYYKEHLLSIKDGQLIKVGPLNKHDAYY